MFNDFKKFLLRGNVIDLAVAVVIGAAFTGVVQAMVKGLITPLIGAFYSQDRFSQAYFTINGSQFLYGEVVNAVVNFLIVAAIIFFLVVTPTNKLVEFSKRKKAAEEPKTQKCPQCLSEIPVKAVRCAHCTSKIA